MLWALRNKNISFLVLFDLISFRRIDSNIIFFFKKKRHRNHKQMAESEYVNAKHNFLWWKQNILRYKVFLVVCLRLIYIGLRGCVFGEGLCVDKGQEKGKDGRIRVCESWWCWCYGIPQGCAMAADLFLQSGKHAVCIKNIGPFQGNNNNSFILKMKLD